MFFCHDWLQQRVYHTLMLLLTLYSVMIAEDREESMIKLVLGDATPAASEAKSVSVGPTVAPARPVAPPARPTCAPRPRVIAQQPRWQARQYPCQPIVQDWCDYDCGPQCGIYPNSHMNIGPARIELPLPGMFVVKLPH